MAAPWPSLGPLADSPVDQLGTFRRAQRMSRVPWPFRRLAWWLTLNLFGRIRAHNFGTFGITTVASQGAGVLHLIPLLTSTLHYGLLDAKGSLDVRLTIDHRVLDGSTAARALG